MTKRTPRFIIFHQVSSNFPSKMTQQKIGVRFDTLYKDQVRMEEEACRNWESRWGFLIEDYKYVQLVKKSFNKKNYLIKRYNLFNKKYKSS